MNDETPFSEFCDGLSETSLIDFLACAYDLEVAPALDLDTLWEIVTGQHDWEYRLCSYYEPDPDAGRD